MPPRKRVAKGFTDEIKAVLKAISDKKVEDLVILDVAQLAGYADYFIIGTGGSSTHVQAMAEAAAFALKKVRGVGTGVRLEGLQTGTWVLIDGGDFVLHLFQPDARRFYGLDDLWGDAPQLTYDEKPVGGKKAGDDDVEADDDDDDVPAPKAKKAPAKKPAAKTKTGAVASTSTATKTKAKTAAGVKSAGKSKTPARKAASSRRKAAE